MAVIEFSFRGGALSSLCTLSESVTVTTATAIQAPMGTILVFDEAGCPPGEYCCSLNMNSPIPFHVS
jgi:hypothetical protein